MTKNRGTRLAQMVGLAILVAIVVALQVVGSFIRIGAFSVSLVLVPIVVGAVMYGKAAGAILGGAFGIVVMINCATGVDIGGNILWVANPAMTAALCLLKGALAGFAAGAVYAAFSKNNEYLGILCASIACPVANTGIFIASLILFYHSTLVQLAGDSSVFYFAFVTLAGLNFLLELGANIALSQAVMRVVRAVKTDRALKGVD